jgi:rfaE bifunctional protein kinase chain/domain
MATVRERLLGRIKAWSGSRIVVVGDPVLDVYLFGSSHRISREAPVLVVREDSRELRLGGAANAAANLAALGAQTELVGLVGTDQAASELAALAEARGIIMRQVRTTGRHTLTKMRVLAGGLHTRKQQMLRIDRENDGPPSPADADRLILAAREAALAADAVVISDYSDGAMVPIYAAIARQALALNKPVIVDSRTGMGAFAGVTALKGNEPEVEEALQLQLSTAKAARAAAERLVAELGLGAALVTRGEEGMALATREGRSALVPPHGRLEAVDVTGAGDTVTATLALGLASGASVLESAILANCAGALVVRKLGAATTSPRELAEAIEALEQETLSLLGGAA